jgi:predicted ATPase/DNA-binding winged helix-turn-helix (wHTH) protein
MVFVFDECELDLDRFELRVRGQTQPVEPQVLDVLTALVRHRERVVSKEELLDEVWHHRFVTESALTSRIKSARRAIGDDGTAQRLIRTVHGRGYQFIGDVRVDEAQVARRSTPVPEPATPTVGRVGDIERVVALLDRERLVTLLGPGGVGKTRLAVEVARRYGDRTADEVCFVDLTRVRAAELVPELIVRELGVHSAVETEARQMLEEALRGRSLLLLLDNFEHVIDAAGIVAEILRWCPGARVLATSRARLRVAGEQVVEVAPLQVGSSAGHPPGRAEAVTLFEQVARAVDPTFELDAHLTDVVAMCRALDGLPLAIELAAGHVRTLPPELLRARLGARLASPSGAARDAPARQRTIQATIDWSLQLLTPSEQRLFTRLGVFSGPVPLEAVEAVGGDDGDSDTVEVLSRLIDQSLVQRVSGVRNEPRFVLLELLRERARELLAIADDADVVAERHAEHVASFLESVEERRWSELSDRWIALVTELLAEIRAAHGWAQLHAPGIAARIAANLGTYCHREGHYPEGRRWVDAALGSGVDHEPVVRARLHLAGGFVEWPRDQRVARAHWEQAIEAFTVLEDDRYVAYSMALAAGTYLGDRDGYEHAMRLCDDGIARARHVGDRPLIAQALNVKGELARVNGDDELALDAYLEGRDLAIAAGDDAHLSAFLANLSYLANHRGHHDEARRLGCAALRLCRSLGRRMMAAWTVSELAGPELALGRPERAARLVGAADEALRVLGAPRHPGDVDEHERVVADLRGALGDDELQRLFAEGAELSLDEAVALALDEPPDRAPDGLADSAATWTPGPSSASTD